MWLQNITDREHWRYIHTHVHTRIYIYIHINMYIHTHVCMCIYIYMYPSSTARKAAPKRRSRSREVATAASEWWLFGGLFEGLGFWGIAGTLIVCRGFCFVGVWLLHSFHGMLIRALGLRSHGLMASMPKDSGLTWGSRLYGPRPWTPSLLTS